MARYERDFLGLADLYRAYRKAKADSFYENSHFHALAFAKYEKSLHFNLQKLLVKLRDVKSSWAADVDFLGGCEFFPKAISIPGKEKSDGIHFATLNHFEDWRASCAASAEKVTASFRQVIVPSVDYQVISALWIIKVGHMFDAAQDKTCSYGHRLRRLGSSKHSAGRLNLDCNGLFAPYFFGYGSWRRTGLNAMRAALENGADIYSVTMDIRQFYHSIAPVFILRDDFLKRIGVVLTRDEKKLTEDLLSSMAAWYKNTPDYIHSPARGLPVGLSASKIISNVLMVDFDALVKTKLDPVYYGRYVDDIFLVIRSKKLLSTGVDFMRWLGTELAPYVVFRQESKQYYLKYSADYALDSEIIFAGDKQKIFHLQGRYGLDLFDQISEQIRKQSSEHRLLPILPGSESEMLSQALLTTPDASIEPDALRKADTVSVRRLGFSLLVRDIESYARDLRPKDWRKSRHMFYGLVDRHVLTPRGFFDYFVYICRVFGLMIACGDFKAALDFLERFSALCDLMRETTTAGTSAHVKFESSVEFYIKAFSQVALQASTVKQFRFGAAFLKVLRRLRNIKPVIAFSLGEISVRQVSKDLLLSDLGRRPYREYWYKENRAERSIPEIPKRLSVNRVLRLDLIRNFRRNLDRKLNPPYWPAVTFPTRPLSIAEITAIAPELLGRTNALRDAIFALRGARVSADAPPFSAYYGPNYCISVQSTEEKKSYTVAVTSFKSTEAQWQDAFDGKPDRSLERYQKFRSLINGILSSAIRSDYVTFPELSIPRRWAFGAAIKLANNGCSLIAGLENGNQGGQYRNDALVSLTTKWPGYKTHVYFVQPKILPAHRELVAIAEAGKRMFSCSLDQSRPIYLHGNHHFGVLICSDLTSIQNRSHFQGCIDTLFVVEWNPDINTFAYLVESASHDLHAYIVQANNRTYGDSRIRGPFVKEFQRDIVRVRGGEEDYFVIAKIGIADLRKFQNEFSPELYEKFKKDQIYKPLPIGFELSDLRKAKN